MDGWVIILGQMEDWINLKPTVSLILLFTKIIQHILDGYFFNGRNWSSDNHNSTFIHTHTQFENKSM